MSSDLMGVDWDAATKISWVHVLDGAQRDRVPHRLAPLRQSHRKFGRTIPRHCRVAVASIQILESDWVGSRYPPLRSSPKNALWSPLWLAVSRPSEAILTRYHLQLSLGMGT